MGLTRTHVTLDGSLQATIDVRDFTFVADEPVEDGGTNEGPNPPEIMLSSLGACVVMTMQHYAKRKGWEIGKVEIELELEKVNPADYPAYADSATILHVIRKQYTFHGDLDESQKARLIEIGGKCPVARVIQHPIIFEEIIKDTAREYPQ
jgi:putative redox protein